MPKLTVRVSEEQLDAWKEAAWIRKVTLSDWVRKVLDATAERTKDDGDH